MTEKKEGIRLKTVIPAAGWGTRLLPATKEQPKEMLPVFERSLDDRILVKPFLQVVFERLYDAGSRDFCFVVGRGKRSIEDHFTLDSKFLDQLEASNKIESFNELSSFYSKVNRANIVFVNQPEPTGFGAALLRAGSFTGKDSFIVHAGDDLIVSAKNHYIKRLINAFQENDADAVFFVQKVKNPERYGIVEAKKMRSTLLHVVRVEEKPTLPHSNLAIVAIYVFSPKIIEAIRRVQPKRNEVELTEAIQYLIDQDCSVYALELEKGDKRIDIGTPESYWNVLQTLQKRQRNQVNTPHSKEFNFNFQSIPAFFDCSEANTPVLICRKGNIKLAKE